MYVVKTQKTLPTHGGGLIIRHQVNHIYPFCLEIGRISKINTNLYSVSCIIMLDFCADDEVFDIVELVLVLNMHEILVAGQSETKQNCCIRDRR